MKYEWDEKKHSPYREENGTQADKNPIEIDNDDFGDSQDLLHKLRGVKEPIDTLKRLRLPEERYHHFFEYAPVGYFILDTEGRIEDVNICGADFLGIRREDLIETLLSDFIAVEDVDAYRSFMNELSESRIRQTCEVRLIERKGNRRYVKLDGVIGDNLHDGSFSYRMTMTDITDLKYSLSALRTNEKNLKRELRHYSAMTIFLKTLMTAKDLNEISRLVLDIALDLTESPIGFSCYIDPKTDKLICPHFKMNSSVQYDSKHRDDECVSGGGMTDRAHINAEPLIINRSSEISQSAILPQGHVEIQRFLSVPAKIGDEMFGQIAIANSDIDYIPKDLGLIENLAAIYALAIRDKMHEEKLIQAKEAAVMGNRIKSQFLARMSHEIRTPLNSIIGMSRIFQETSLTPTQKDYLETIQLSSELLLYLVNDILDFSKIEAGKLRLFPADFNLENLFKDIRNMFVYRCKEKGLALTFDIDPKTTLNLKGDRGRLLQILSNLVGNAVKFTERGEVSISASQIDANENTVTMHFTVADTGIGIPGDKLESIFDSFSQLDNSIKRKFGGTGLGLSISKQLVELMGGSIHVESKEGEGSIFSFSVPLHKSEEPMEESGTADDSSLPKPKQGGDRFLRVYNDRPVRVLIVEDHPPNRKVAAEVVKRLKYEFDFACDGKQAIEKLRHTHFDIVFMDIQMPEIDGIEATYRIRSQTEGVLNPNIPIVAMTAHAMQEDRWKCLQAGMNDYISKPFDFDEIRDIVERLVIQSSAPMASSEIENGDETDRKRFIFDHQKFLKRLGGDIDVFYETLNLFIKQTSTLIGKIKQGIENDDLKSVFVAAHTIKGGADNISAKQLAEVARRIEQCAKEAEMEKLEPLTGHLDVAFTAFKTRFRLMQEEL